MKQVRRASSILLAAAVAIGLAACGSSGKSGGSDSQGSAGQSQPAQPQSASSPGKRPNIAFVGADLPDPFYLTMKCGAEAGAKQFDVNLSWQGTNGVDFGPELTIFNATLQKHPDGVILAPFSATAFVQPVANAMKNGIPVVTVDGSLSQKVELQNVRTDNLKAGGLAATGLGKLLNGKGSVAVVSFAPDVPVQKDRVDGFKNVIAKDFPGIKVVSVQYGGADSGKSATVTAGILQKYPSLSGIYATDTNDADGAASAIQAAGKRGKVKLVAYDATPKAIAGLKSGLYDGIVSQSPYEEGYTAVKTLSDYLTHKTQKSDIKYLYGTGSAYIDRSNADSPAVKQYLYRTTC